MKRFTICGLRAFVDYVNDTVPKIVVYSQA